MAHISLEISRFLQPLYIGNKITGVLPVINPLFYELRQRIKSSAVYLASRSLEGTYILSECGTQEFPDIFRSGRAYVFDTNIFGRNELVVVESTPIEAARFANDSLGTILEVDERPGSIRVEYRGPSRPNDRSYVGWLHPIIYATDSPLGRYVPREHPFLEDQDLNHMLQQLRKKTLDGNGLTVPTTYDRRLSPKYPTAFAEKHQSIVVIPEEQSEGVSKMIFLPAPRRPKGDLVAILRNSISHIFS